MEFKNDIAHYSWQDNSGNETGEVNESKFIIKDIDDVIIIDNIETDVNSAFET
jgi:hypothetical protein